jgi:glycosyltransferase involved in cell wall biosynthesis
MVHISVVVPMLNEELIVSELVERVNESLKELTNDYEIILIDDGSKDQTWQNITKICEKNNKIKKIKFSRNFGQHSAISAGIDIARGQWIVVMDGDLQDRPEVISNLYAKATEGFDTVFVSRIKRNESQTYLIMQNVFYKILRHLSGINYDRTQANFSIISRKAAEQYRRVRDNNKFYPSTIKSLGFKNSSVSALQGKRYSGRPSYSFKKRFKLGINIITSVSNKPLSYAFILGIFSILSFLLCATWYAYNIFTDTIQVDKLDIILLAILSMTGIILTSIGIAGVYIGKIYDEIRGMPKYIVDE